MSTGTGQSHNITTAETVTVGGVVYQKAQSARRGVPLASIQPVEFGAVDTLDADGVCVAATATGATTLSATGALVSGGVATFDVARGWSITSTGDESGITFTGTGTDDYGETLVETVTGPNATTVTSQKAFKTMTSVEVSGALTTTGGVNVGTSDVLGLPYRLADVGKFLGMTMDGDAVDTTLVAGMDSDGTSTATTADVRGTVLPATAANGTRMFSAMMVLEARTTKEKVYGTAQYGG